MKILVVEDESQIANFIKQGLEAAGFIIDYCENGNDGLLRATNSSYDAIVLDIMLPGRDGLSILRCLRERGSSVPVILLTARNTLNERIEGLNLGADDYLTKPFFIEELIARLHAVARRAAGDSMSTLSADELSINLITREVNYRDKIVDLTSREFNLLTFLMRSPGRVYTRTQILEHVWEYFFDPETNLVDVYIKRIRKKLKEAAGDATVVETVRGVGYRIRKDS